MANTIEEQRESELRSREENPDHYDELRARQAEAHTREDVAGLLLCMQIALGELRLIRWVLVALLCAAVVLIART
jgi:hypothetical protein